MTPQNSKFCILRRPNVQCIIIHAYQKFRTFPNAKGLFSLLFYFLWNCLFSILNFSSRMSFIHWHWAVDGFRIYLQWLRGMISQRSQSLLHQFINMVLHEVCSWLPRLVIIRIFWKKKEIRSWRLLFQENRLLSDSAENGEIPRKERSWFRPWRDAHALWYMLYECTNVDAKVVSVVDTSVSLERDTEFTENAHCSFIRVCLMSQCARIGCRCWWLYLYTYSLHIGPTIELQVTNHKCWLLKYRSEL